RPRHHIAGFLGERQQPPRIGQQPLAGLRRCHILARAVQKRLADIVLQPLDLLADGRLGAVDAFAGAGEAAGIDHRDETAEQLKIKHASQSFINPLHISLSFNFQIATHAPTSSDKGDPMSLAPPIAVPRARFNPLPLYIALFCLLWSFAFVAGKIGVTDCPPLILLAARFSLAGVLILGITALRGEAWSSLTWRDAAIFAILGVANNALYLGFGSTGLKTVSAGHRGLLHLTN